MNDKLITVKEIGNHGKNEIEGLPDPYFKPVIDGKELSIIAETYEIAYIAGLGVKYLGHNSSFTMLTCRMLGIRSCWSGLE